MAPTCIACAAVFGRQSTLNRHNRAIHGLASFSCSYCYRSFSRKDILERHIDTCHRPSSSSKVECAVCNIKLDRRSLQSHFKSDRHQHALQRARSSRNGRQAGHDKTRLLQLEAPLDARLVTSFLFCKANTILTDFCFDFWIKSPADLRIQVSQLQQDAIRSISSMLRHHSSSTRMDALAPVVMMSVVEMMLGEFESANVHVRVLEALMGRGNHRMEKLEWAPFRQLNFECPNLQGDEEIPLVSFELIMTRMGDQPQEVHVMGSTSTITRYTLLAPR